MTDACLIENRHTGEKLTLRRVTRNGQLSLELEGSLPPGREGPPLHIHHFENEEGRVVAGTLAAEIGGKSVRAGAGRTVLLPVGIPHRWWNGGEDMLVFEGYAFPLADLDLYLQAAFDVINSGPAGRPPLFYMAHLAWRHRRKQAVLFAPRWAQPVLLAAIVAVGTLLGRYRGTHWPGCPAKFAPAPMRRQAAA